MDLDTLQPAASSTRTIHEDRAITSRAIVAGGLAALAGDAAWVVVALVTESEVGYMATIVGVLAGSAVHFSVRKYPVELSTHDSVRLRIIAAANTLGGLVVGKYLIFDLEHGGFSPGVMQSRMPAYFLRMLPGSTTAFDAVWVILAVGAAWTLTRMSQLGRRA